jgi:hypothetical protein
METGQRLVDRMPSNPRTMAFISTQERYSHVLLCISICFPHCFILVLHYWSISFSLKVRGSSTPRVVVWVCSWCCPCIGPTAAQHPPPLASTATPLREGVLNPCVEGATLLMILQVVPVDPMWERGDVPHLAYQAEWTAHLISWHGWLIFILLRAKERYWQSSNCNSKVLLYTVVFFVLPMHYSCFLFCSCYLPAVNPLPFIFFTSDSSGSRPENMAFVARFFLFTTITNTCTNKHMPNHLQTGSMISTILLGWTKDLDFFKNHCTLFWKPLQNLRSVF